MFELRMVILHDALPNPPQNEVNINERIRLEHDNAVRFATQLRQRLVHNYHQFARYCRIRNGIDDNSSSTVIIDITCPVTNRTSSVEIVSLDYTYGGMIPPRVHTYGNMFISCFINGYDGPFLELSMASLNEILNIVHFCLSILRYQGYQEILEDIYIPVYLRNLWYISNRLRENN